jgi:hypothetical protein
MIDSNSFLFSYTIPKIDEVNNTTKPVSYTGKKYPLSSLHHREFEVLIYSLYQQEIEKGKLPYDDIGLMSGVRDQAQDCVLYKANTKVGIIQCKHSEIDKKIGLTSCKEEIIKFILYYIKDNSLIPNLSNFKYYFASSSGFEAATYDYLNQFKQSIEKERNLATIVKKVLKKFSSIGLVYKVIEAQFIQAIKQLEVKPIQSEDIQNLLELYKTTTVKRFFEVTLVIENSLINNLKKDIEEIKKNTQKRATSPEKIKSEFSNASLFLSEYKNSFSLKEPITIERSETGQIFNWLTNSLNLDEENISVLKGGAGCGKSVVLNNLYKKLKEHEIPTIGIKTDELNGENLNVLQQKLGLSNPLIDSIDILSSTSEYPLIVVILDQLDALSQSLSANRNNLNTYLLLVEKLKSYRNVRIIVSLREFDLRYDPALNKFKKFTSFIIGILERDFVTSILTKLNISLYSESLIALLSIPLHLEIFTTIYNDSKKVKIESLYELYNEYWNLKTNIRKDKIFTNSIQSTLYSIAIKIYNRQNGLSVSAIGIEIDVIDYCKTNGILLENGRNEIMFFHQTFYDYVFARQFVEQTNDLVNYLDTNNQGLNIRSSLKIILSHLRECNVKSYEAALRYIFTNEKVRYHIKQLTIDLIGYIKEPLRIELKIINETLIGTPLENAYVESINSHNQLNIFLKGITVKSFLQLPDKQQLLLNLFSRNTYESSQIISDFLLNLSDDDKNKWLIQQVLYFLNTWSINTIKLFEKVNTEISFSPYMFCRCMERAVLFDDKWALEKTRSYFISKTVLLSRERNDYPIDHYETEFIENLFEKYPEQTFVIVKELVETIIDKVKWENVKGGLNEDGALYFFTNNRSKNLSDDGLFQVFINEIEKRAIKKVKSFDDFINEHANSNSIGIIKIMIYGLLKNPSVYYNESLKIITHVYAKQGFSSSGKLDYFIRQLITNIYSFLSYNDKIFIIKMIEETSSEYEMGIFINPNTNRKEKRTYEGYTQYQFLTCIPLNELKQIPTTFKRFQELHRKFGNLNDREPNVIETFGVSAPYTKETYEKMGLEDWTKTLYKYDNEFEPDFFSHKGGLTEHARAFEDEVSKKPDYFYVFIKELLLNAKIAEEYKIMGITGLIKAKFSLAKVTIMAS